MFYRRKIILALLEEFGNELSKTDFEKYLDMANNKDIYLFLGTTKEHHRVSKNPFIIIGVFYPKKEEQHLLKI